MRMPELSLDKTVNGTETAADNPFEGEMLILGGQLIAGGAESTIVKGNVQVFTLPALSMAVHITFEVV